MPYDVVAFEADEIARRLSIAEEGIFHRMLRLAWMNGSIPTDLNDLAQLCRIRPSTLQKAWPKLSKLWTPLVDNPLRLVNKKQETERIFLESKRAAFRESGKLSWKSLKRKKNKRATLKGPSCDPPASPSPSQPIPTVEEKKETPYIAPLLVLGEFGNCRLTGDQFEKLKSKLNGHHEAYIEAFDHWVNEAPTARPKAGGPMRSERHAYESITAWFNRDVREGKVKNTVSQKTSSQMAEELRRRHGIQ